MEELRVLGALRSAAVESEEPPGIIETRQWTLPPIDPQSMEYLALADDLAVVAPAEQGGLWIYLDPGPIAEGLLEDPELGTAGPDMDAEQADAVLRLILGQVRFTSTLSGEVLEACGYERLADGRWRWTGTVADLLNAGIGYRVPDYGGAGQQ